jgi:O-antigen/teichoic acid export membrane protein
MKKPNNRAITSWFQRGFWAVLDQSLFAGANFLVNILLARWLSQPEYGAFTLVYSVFLLFGAFHTAILTEPMLVFGSGKYADDFKKYLGVLFYGHLGLTTLLSLILAVSAHMLWTHGPPLVAETLRGLAIAAPFVLLVWLLRRALYLCLLPQRAAAGGALYLLITIISMYGCYRGDFLSSFLALQVIGGASLIVGSWLTFILHPDLSFRNRHPSPIMVLNDHCAYGKWSIATALLTWIPGNICYTLLPAWAGLESVAALGAVMNLVMPMLHANSAIAIFLIPEFGRALREGGKEKLAKLVNSVLLLFALPSLLYWILLICYRSELLMFFYQDRYAGYADSIILIGFLPISAAAVAVLGGALRAMEHPNLVFIGYAVSTLLALTLGIWLVAKGGLWGALLWLIVTSVTTGTTMAWFCFRNGLVFKLQNAP